MRAIKFTHIAVAVFATSTCLLLIGAFFVINGAKEHPKRARARASSELDRDGARANTEVQPRLGQQEVTNKPGEVLRLAQVDIVGNPTGSWLDDHYTQRFEYDGPLPEPIDESRTGTTGDVTTEDQIKQKEAQLLEHFPQMKAQVESNRAARTELVERTARLGMGAEQYALENELRLEK